MSDFINNAANKFAKIVHADTVKYQELDNLKERFDKEISAYSNELSKKIFIEIFELELKALFKSHLERCKKTETCPQHLTFQNANFLISELSKEEKISSYLIDNSVYNDLISYYNQKTKTVATFLDKEVFIKQEIQRIKSTFLNKKIITSIQGGTIIAQFDFSEYSQNAYDWLMAGQDCSFSQILKSARGRYLQNFNRLPEKETFETAIRDNLISGVAYVLYEKFLNDILTSVNQKDSGNKTLLKRRTKIPNKIRSLLQKEINSSCPFSSCRSQDVDHFEIHHIDENRENNSYGNLIMICPTCHSKITKGDITMEIVVDLKKSFGNGNL